MDAILAPTRLLQDMVTTIFRVWTLVGIVRSKGRKVYGLIAFSVLCRVLEILHRHLSRSRIPFFDLFKGRIEDF